jgi:hypothetical protein
LDVGDQLAVEKVLNPKTLSPKPSLLFPLSFLLSLLSLLCLLLSASLAVDGIWEAYRRGRERGGIQESEGEGECRHTGERGARKIEYY